MALEREIKLRFDSADEARTKILALGATPLHGRRLQEDALLDDQAGKQYGGKSRFHNFKKSRRRESGRRTLPGRGPGKSDLLGRKRGRSEFGRWSV